MGANRDSAADDSRLVLAGDRRRRRAAGHVLVRTCRPTFGNETWEFGDGSATFFVRSDVYASGPAKDGCARMEQVFRSPDDYLVKVERSNERGEKAIGRLWVPVRK